MLASHMFVQEKVSKQVFQKRMINMLRCSSSKSSERSVESNDNQAKKGYQVVTSLKSRGQNVSYLPTNYF